MAAEAWESAAAGGLATRVRWPWWEDDDSSDQKMRKDGFGDEMGEATRSLSWNSY